MENNTVDTIIEDGMVKTAETVVDAVGPAESVAKLHLAKSDKFLVFGASVAGILISELVVVPALTALKRRLTTRVGSMTRKDYLTLFDAASDQEDETDDVDDYEEE